ncbi:hypothetical protein PENTCL1PPCAC_20443 [Pristionchus entomophagus]|uniref:GPN-loop GTPase 2 n=1 Tax=Pristionchus entomophagus TaxID=358040 RepID=A0AAV5TW76_9BILA|nr:hypothetical protein PENTCL1PPCAC_20443 [Pristionchus entomophagus]
MTMWYGALIIGAPGSGKSTFTAALSDCYTQLARDFMTINLDPANHTTPYHTDADIQELITVEEAMDRLGLGPNGALRYCMQTLSANAQWLVNKIKTNKKGKYLLIDCPGQLELYRTEGEMDKLIRALESNGVRLCAVHLTDSLYCPDPASFVSVVMSTLSAMVALEMPQINVLSKADLFNEAELPFDLDFYTKLPDITKLVDVLDEHPLLARHAKLNRAIGEVIQDMGLVSFTPLNIQSKADLARLICTIDKANGFQLIDKDIRDIVLQ